MQTKVNIHEAKTNLSGILLEVEKKNKNFLICRNGKPIAELKPLSNHSRKKRLKIDPRLKIKIIGDPLEPLSPEDIFGFEEPK